MFGTDLRLEEVLMTMKVQEAHRLAASRAPRCGLQERQQMRRGHQVVRYLGYHLILLGQRLERYGLPQPSFTPDQLRTGSGRAHMVGN